MDPLENFVRSHRAAFDDATPPSDLWRRIKADLDKGQSSKGRSFTLRSLLTPLSMVASIVLLLFAGALAGIYVYKGQLGHPSGSLQASLAQVAPEYAEQERYLQLQVNNNLQRLTAYEGADAVTSDLQQLDEIFHELARELESAPKGSEERIIQAMLENYRTRVSILERVLEKVEGTSSESSPQPSKPSDYEITI
jgi:hypothetical protein